MSSGKLKTIFAILGINIAMVLMLVVGFRIGMYYANTGPEHFGFISEKNAAAPAELVETAEPVTEPELSPAELDQETERLLSAIRNKKAADALIEEEVPAEEKKKEEEVAAEKPVEEKPVQEEKITQEKKAEKKEEPNSGRIVDALHLKGKSFYTVQVRSSHNRQLAEELVENYKKKGYFAFLGARKIKGREWYRINVGRFEDKQVAEDFKKRFSRNHNVPDAIVQYFQ